METLSGDHWKIHVGDVMEGLALVPDKSVHCVVTSPPYWGLRDYGFEGQIGAERTPEEFVATMVRVFSEVRRALRDDGVLFLNLGDTYSGGGRGGGSEDCKQRTNVGSLVSTRSTGIPPANLFGMPWRVAFALQADGWILRRDIVWSKPDPMPESVSGWRWKDGELRKGSWRPTTSHEMVFMFSKSSKYFCDGDGSKEPSSGTAHARGKGVNPKAESIELTSSRHGQSKQNPSFSAAVSGLVATRNVRSVWKITKESYKGAHFATFPTELVRRCLLPATSRAGCCSICGNQFAPVVEAERIPTRPGTDSKVNRVSAFDDSPYHGHSGTIVGNRDPHRHQTNVAVLGYLPTCECRSSVGRPVVLDPFGGSMTTGQVAINMGCDFIGCEGNPEYAALGVTRINTPWIPVSERKKPKSRRRKKVVRQQDLF